MSHATSIRPAQFCEHLLSALESSEGQSRRRKRDQTPDRLGLSLRRHILEQAVHDDPEPAAFEGWLMQQVFHAAAGGPVRAMCAQILDEYRMLELQPSFRAWLEAGAPSADSAPEPRVKSDEEVMGPRHRRPREDDPEKHWCPICSSELVRFG